MVRIDDTSVVRTDTFGNILWHRSQPRLGKVPVYSQLYPDIKLQEFPLWIPLPLRFHGNALWLYRKPQALVRRHYLTSIFGLPPPIEKLLGRSRGCSMLFKLVRTQLKVRTEQHADLLD